MTNTTSSTITASAGTTNPLQELRKFGQSAWLDYIRRSLITGGELKRLVDEDGLGGVTSNPAIFEKAITGSTDYADALVELQKRKDLDAMGVYEIIAIKDIQDAADILRPVYDATKMRDGYVSLEVSPFLARDTEGTIKDARRLWKAVNRPNLLVKVPATLEGIPAIEQAHQRRHQHQRDAAVRAGDVRKGRAGLHRGTEEIRGGRRRSEPRRQRRQLLHQPHRQHGGFDPEGQDEGQHAIPGSRRCSRACKARWRSQTASSRISATKRFFREPIGRRWRRRARRRSACCGPAPAPRIRLTPTCSMSKS